MPFPSRLDHSHPLNVVEKVGPTGANADSYVKAVGAAVTGPSGTGTPERAAFGTQNFYARVDHIHPICAETGPAASQSDNHIADTLYDGTPNSKRTKFSFNDNVTIDLNTHTWSPGSVGWKESYCCRVVKFGTNNMYRYFIFRQRIYSRTGQLIYIGPEYVGFRVRFS